MHPGGREHAVAAAPAEKEAEKSSDEAYIETARCASCNECIQINDKMFVYDGNKQESIGDIKLRYQFSAEMAKAETDARLAALEAFHAAGIGSEAEYQSSRWHGDPLLSRVHHRAKDERARSAPKHPLPGF